MTTDTRFDEVDNVRLLVIMAMNSTDHALTQAKVAVGKESPGLVALLADAMAELKSVADTLGGMVSQHATTADED